MKRICLFSIFLILVSNLSYAKDPYKVMKFVKFYDDDTFAFKMNPIRNIPCKMYDLQVISLNDNPGCAKDIENIKKYKKMHKKDVEKVLKPGENYFVTLKGKTNSFYYCDVSTDKKNMRLSLVKAGFALPLTDNKKLKEANQFAKNNKLGMYSDKYKDITKCLLFGIGNDKEENKNENSAPIIQNQTPIQNKIKIEIL